MRAIGVVVWAILTGAASAEPLLDLTAELRAVKGDPLVVVDLNRPLIIRELLKRWETDFQQWLGSDVSSSSGAVQYLSRLPSDRLYQAALAQTFEASRSALQNATERVRSEKILGDVGRDLAYTAVTPCRVVDTRFGGGGFVGAGTQRGWQVSRPGGSFSDQGGANSDCGVPASPAAVMINVAVFGSSQPGNVYAWPYGQALPNATILNFAAGETISNGVIVAVSQGQINDLSVSVSASANVVVDLLGYFKAPALSAITIQSLTGSTFLNPGGLATIATTTNCSPGVITVSGSCSSSSYYTLLSSAFLNNSNGYSCAYFNNSSITQSITVQAYCISLPARALP